MHRMAAGKNGDRKNSEFRSREVSRKEISYSKSEYYNVKNGDYERIPIRNGVIVRQKDTKKNGFLNNGSDSGGSSSGSKEYQNKKVLEREPGELSSESDSDESTNDLESLETKKRDISPVDSKKRKFSLVVWDKKVSNTGFGLDNGVRISNFHKLEPLLAKAGLDIRDESDSDSESDSVVDMSNSELQQEDVFTEKKQPEDEDFVPTRHILASRWAGEADSSADEGEISQDENKPRKRYKMSSGRNKSLTPKLGQNDYMEIDDHPDIIGDNISLRDSESENEHYSCGSPEPVVPPQRNLNMLQGCRSVDDFERLNKIDEGTYGVVFRAKDKKTGEIVALKKVKMEKEREGFPLTSLREINILLSFHHPSIVNVKEVVVGSSLDSIFMVMEYMEHDLKGLMETMKHPFSQSEVKCLMLQLLEGVQYLHDNWVLNRDMKTSNILLNNQGELKICDFGLSRQYGSPLKPYTQLVVTLWYRSPELLLGAKQYSTAIDMWSLGCIMAELLSKQPLFNGKTEFDQLDKIFRMLGTPNETIWPGFSKLPGVKLNFVKHQYNQLHKKFPAASFTGSPVLSDAGFDLLSRLLTYDPEKRITAEEALKHEWFREVPLPKSKEFMPTFPAQHAQDRRLRRIMKSPDPLMEQHRKELKQKAALGMGGLFG